MLELMECAKDRTADMTKLDQASHDKEKVNKEVEEGADLHTINHMASYDFLQKHCPI